MMFRSIVFTLACLGSLLSYTLSDLPFAGNFYADATEQTLPAGDDAGPDDLILAGEFLWQSRRFLASGYDVIRLLLSKSAIESYLIRAPPFRQQASFDIA